jgi:Domain of unknown function (DUF397)
MNGARSGASEGPVAAEIKWRVSSFCAAGECIAVAKLPTGEIGMRDTKDRAGPVLRFNAAEWRAFIAGVRAGEFDA